MHTITNRPVLYNYMQLFSPAFKYVSTFQLNRTGNNLPYFRDITAAWDSNVKVSITTHLMQEGTLTYRPS